MQRRRRRPGVQYYLRSPLFLPINHSFFILLQPKTLFSLLWHHLHLPPQPWKETCPLTFKSYSPGFDIVYLLKTCSRLWTPLSITKRTMRWWSGLYLLALLPHPKWVFISDCSSKVPRYWHLSRIMHIIIQQHIPLPTWRAWRVRRPFHMIPNGPTPSPLAKSQNVHSNMKMIWMVWTWDGTGRMKISLKA